jgi:hypothetical protein
MRPEQVRRHFLLAALYVREQGARIFDRFTDNDLCRDIGSEYLSDLREELGRSLRYLREARLIEETPRRGLLPHVSLTAAGVDALERFSRDSGVDVVDLVAAGRLRLLVKMHDLSGGTPGLAVDYRKAARRAELGPEELSSALGYLDREGLAEVQWSAATASSVSVTTKGVAVVQGDLSSAGPDRSSGVTVQFQGSVAGSQIMVGSHGAQQHQSSSSAAPDYGALADRLQAVLEHLNGLALPSEDRDDVQDDATKLLNEVRKDDPNPSRIARLREGVAKVLSPLAVGGASGVATEAVKAFLAWS